MKQKDGIISFTCHNIQHSTFIIVKCVMRHVIILSKIFK